MINYLRMKGKLFFAFSVILALGALILLSRKGNDITILPSYQTSSMQGLHLTHKADNKIKWELKADDATFPEGNKEIIISSLELKIYTEQEIHITGGSGIYKIDRKTLTINKPVEINMNDTKLITNVLTWDGREGLIRTDDSIKFSGENFLIEGTGLAARIKHQKIRILKNVKGIFYL